MKILILGCKEWPYGISAKYESFPGGGTAKYIEVLVNGLLGSGHEVILITRRFPDQENHEIISNLEIIRVPFINNKLLRLPSFSFNSTIKAFFVKKVDVIHAHLAFSILFGFYLSKIRKIPLVGTPHGSTANQWSGIIRRVFSYIEKTTYPKIAKVIFFSENDKQKFETLLNTKYNNYEVVYSGIEVQKKSNTITNQSLFSILFVGRLVSVKRIDNLLKGIAELDPITQSKMKLIIVGDGYEKSNLMKLVHELKIDNIVQFEGFQNNVNQYYKTADLLILPSDSEGFPFSVLEAMSFGLPCLINDFNLPINKNAVVLLKDNSPSEIALKINELYCDIGLRKKISERGINEIKTRFNLLNVIANHLNIYKELTINKETEKRKS